MSKRKQKPQHKPSAPSPHPFRPEEHGLKAFHVGNYSEAIRLWSEIGLEANPALRPAVAEAYFRRALTARLPGADPIGDLRRAIALLPDDARFSYHLALALHRADRLDEARSAYAHAAELGSKRRGLAFTRGLAELEADPKLSLDALPWLTPEARMSLAPITGLLRGEPQTVAALPLTGDTRTTTGVDLVGSLWRGLALFADNNAALARTFLAPQKGQRLPPGMEAIRSFYYGLAAVMVGDTQAALAIWRETPREGAQPNAPAPLLLHGAYIAQLSAQSIVALQKAGQWKEALAQAQAGLTLAPNDPWLLRATLIAAGQLAETARQAGDWSGAIAQWTTMRVTLQAHPELGPLPPVLRNLAIAHEVLEQWEQAAQLWVALLETFPRRRGRAAKKPDADPGPIAMEVQMAWLRRRIMDSYKRAGRPDEAIAYYKQGVKSEPDNLDLRLELASALLVNEQTIAARNEVKRILERDPKHIEALLLEAEIHKERHDNPAVEMSLRRVLEIDPKHEKARRAVAHMMLERGMDAFNYGQFHQAQKIYTEALKYVPDDVQILAFLGETELIIGDTKSARAHFEIALATRKPQAYAQVFTCWVDHDSEEEARQVLQRAVADGVATPTLYVEMGIACLKHGARSVAKRLGKAPVPTQWAVWGHELVRKGLEDEPDKAESLRNIIAKLGPEHPAIAIEFARQLVALDPDDPEQALPLALLQGLTGDAKGARATLTQAERLARRQGKKEIAERMIEMRNLIGSPMFAIMGPMLVFGGPDLFDDFDEEDFI